MYQKIIVSKVQKSRLDVVLTECYSDLSRSKCSQLIRDGKILVNGTVITKLGYMLESADILEIHGDFTKKESTLEAQPIPLDIIYEDTQILVINKQAGLVVHPGAGNKDNTLVNGLLHYCTADITNIGAEDRPGIVHRLDKNTTGIMVIAKTDTAHRVLSEQFAARTVQKYYIGICLGCPMPSYRMINQPIGRNSKNRTRMAVSTSGRPSVTHMINLSAKYSNYENCCSLILYKLETGRTHQIRVHSQYIGHSLIGDTDYGAHNLPKGVALAQQSYIKTFARQALHSWCLEFQHPTENTNLFFTAPIPQDMQELWQNLNSSSLDKLLPAQSANTLLKMFGNKIQDNR